MFEKAKGIQILDFGLGAELFLAARTYAYVRIAAKVAFFHVASGDIQVLQDLFQLS